jgi:soluble lytic murein transglycosylase
VRRLAVAVLALAGLAIAFAVVHRSTPDWYARLRYPLEYRAIVVGHAENYDLDPALLAAVIYRESKFDADARSSSGAIGLMQLLPDTAEGIALHTGGSKFEVADLYDPEINVRYGSFYLRRLLRKYGDERLALAAYNAGQTNVDEWIANGEGIAFPETRAYVDDVLDARKVYARAYADELGLGYRRTTSQDSTRSRASTIATSRPGPQRTTSRPPLRTLTVSFPPAAQIQSRHRVPRRVSARPLPTCEQTGSGS